MPLKLNRNRDMTRLALQDHITKSPGQGPEVAMHQETATEETIIVVKVADLHLAPIEREDPALGKIEMREERGEPMTIIENINLVITIMTEVIVTALHIIIRAEIIITPIGTTTEVAIELMKIAVLAAQIIDSHLAETK